MQIQDLMQMSKEFVSYCVLFITIQKYSFNSKIVENVLHFKIAILYFI